MSKKDNIGLSLLFFTSLIVGIVLSGCGGSTGSATSDGTSPLVEASIYPAFVDENNNGVNDYIESQWHTGAGHNFVDKNGDGICDYAQDGSNTWHGPGFVDNDGDGICDYWDEDSKLYNQGGGIQFRDQNRNRINDSFEAQWYAGSRNFVDKNGDGICDYAQDGSNTWFGTGFVDNNGDGICDNWQPGGKGYGRR